MDIEEVQNLRAQMGSKIAIAASNAMEEFQRRTGLQVTGIRLDLINAPTIGESRQRSFIEAVKIDIEL